LGTRLVTDAGGTVVSEQQMKAHFFDLENDANPLNGTCIESSAELRNILESLHESLHDRPPFIAELIGDNGFKLMFGLGITEGFVQYSSVEDDPPYDAFVEILAEFVQTGQRKRDVHWEELGPQADV
jgi:hypothetical protein